VIICASVLATVGVAAHAGFLDNLKNAISNTNAPATGATNKNASLSGLGQGEMVDGLKQALGKGVEKAVSSLGRTDGFMTNLSVKIPMPGELQKVESVLRVAGEGKLVDGFELSMNRAAEQAIPAAASVFGDGIKKMTITDAQSILSGPQDGATQYFRRTTQTNLQEKFYPIVRKATDSVGVTSQYKAMMGKFASVNTYGSAFGSKSIVNLDSADIDKYVTGKAMDGLFKMVAEEEKNIRANPVARTTDVLQKVFTAAAK
jgi:hypothetical protein